MSKLDSDSLKSWFLKNRRDLPWRETASPYAVWVSEVMLQQTQVAVVIPYFYRWMERFPSIDALADADSEQVIKTWEGLGYYSRARNLHEGAKYIKKHYQGILPSEAEELKKIKGLGPYTIGAIQSFAFRQKAAAVDGNVMRVAARYKMIKEDISKQKTVKGVRSWILEQLPDKESWLVNEGLIELGATVCKKKPYCGKCPLQGSCLSFRQGCQDTLPIKGGRQASIPLYRTVVVIQSDRHYLVKKGRKGEIMQGLHEFPYFETGPGGWDLKQILHEVERTLGIQAFFFRSLPNVKHSFTKYRASLTPFLLKAAGIKEVKQFEWVSLNGLMKAAFSSGHRKIFDCILSFDCARKDGQAIPI